jgi:hypothetical protein
MATPVIPPMKPGNPFWKAWILPDGNTVPIPMWHAEWLLAQAKGGKLPPKLAKQIAALGPKAGEQSLRLASLNHGFFRVNYGYQGGRLTVEGDSKFLRAPVKKAIRSLVAANLGRIDFFTMNLYRAGHMHDGMDVKLFTLPREERLARLPFVQESASEKFVGLFG